MLYEKTWELSAMKSEEKEFETLTQFYMANLKGSLSMGFPIFSKKIQQIPLMKLPGLKADEYSRSHSSGPIPPLPPKKSTMGQSIELQHPWPFTENSIYPFQTQRNKP